MSLFKIDGKAYNVYVPVGGMRRNFNVFSAQTEQLIHGERIYNVVGTFYGYTVTVDTSRATAEEYDALWEILSSPEAWHYFEFPYGQTTLSFRGHVENGGDTLYIKPAGGVAGWGDLQFSVVAAAPQRRALT